MDHQDFKTVVFGNVNNSKNNNSNKELSKKISQKLTPENTIAVSDKQLGKTIASARTTKGLNQKQLAQEAGVSQQVLATWESNKQVPTNAEIAKLEKILGTKLPRNKKKTIE